MLPSSVKLLFEPRDLWVGVYWNTFRTPADMYGPAMGFFEMCICLIPMLPLRLRWEW